MNTKEIENLIIELDIISKFELNEKPRIRNNKIEIDNYTVLQWFYRITNGDTFDKSITHLNNLCNNMKIICNNLIQMNTDNFVNCDKYNNAHYKSYLNTITLKLNNCVTKGLINLKSTYSMDKNKISYLQFIIDTFTIQLNDNIKYVSAETIDIIKK
jgi:hypothetical protein